MIQETYDVVILGTGPGGLQAAIHAARAKASVLVLGRGHKSSLYRAHIENYCCLSKVSGEELLEQGIRQAMNSGAHFLQEDIIKTTQKDDWFIISTENGRLIKLRALIMAMGITRNRLGVPGEKRFLGKGVSYCVDCDANFYKNAKVAIVGNESAAVSGALTLLFYADQVHLVSDQLKVSEQLDYQIRKSEVILHSRRKVKKIVGKEIVGGIILDDDQRLNIDGVFIETGAKGAIELAAPLDVELDADKFKYIVADKQQQTNIQGIYAAGDICGPPFQMAKAVGEGCVAGLFAARYAKKFDNRSRLET
ncbi:MAG: FAD-dependent oxidoreductase [Deltaproteobacteria bacterium]|nr:FAD-dependent oxidoreductase [Deltaproteobacteria bacterium]MBW2661910.1 FAD-dependent oxidoreductase [Deltaproteobacteria bacterium]